MGYGCARALQQRVVRLLLLALAIERERDLVADGLILVGAAERRGVIGEPGAGRGLAAQLGHVGDDAADRRARDAVLREADRRRDQHRVALLHVAVIDLQIGELEGGARPARPRGRLRGEALVGRARVLPAAGLAVAARLEEAGFVAILTRRALPAASS